MTVKSVLTTLLSVAIALAIAVYAWSAYKNYRVSHFESDLKLLSPAGLSQSLALVADAPNVKCVSTGSNFTTAGVATLYHRAGKTRMDFVYAGGGTSNLHEILDGTDLYLWTDDSDYISHISVDLGQPVPQEEPGTGKIFASVQCTSWDPNDAAFVLPGKPINDYRP